MTTHGPLVYTLRQLAAEDDSQSDQIRAIYERVMRIEQREGE